ncbi:transporter [Patiriisocius marinus]|uniref:Transporter n=1 Tax=Patiriisocius marinus TaxID=1397112 RepID=A0A5J4J0Z8_9FLAO|nr:transporter [Patiriisocius marinus]GER59660.1 transporter [Patiriisocius marinus]
MKKTLLLFVVALSSTLLSAQNITDALRYSVEDSNGTARYQGMSGAFGALGGDFSAMRINPAGSAVFLNSAASVSFSINDIVNETTFNSSQQKRIDTDVDLNQLGGVFVIDIQQEDSAFNKVTIGLNYDVNRNFSNQITARGTSNTSLANFFAAQAEGIPLDLLQLQNGETIGSLYRYLGQTEGTAAQNALLGYQGFIIDPTNPDNLNNTTYLSNVVAGDVNQLYTKLTEGANSKFTVNVGTQIENDYYIGVNLNSHSIDYRERTYNFESNNLAGSSITSIGFENNLAVYGNGFSAQIGGIAKFDNIRVGLSLDTPTWYDISEETSQALETTRREGDQILNTFVNPQSINVFSDYYLKTPGKITGSAAYIFGKSGLISVDYSYKDYANVKFDSDFDEAIFDFQNSIIENTLKGASSIKVGGEYRLNNFSFRAGGRYEESPYQDETTAGDLTGFSLGLGYNFGRYNFDVSYARAQRDSIESAIGFADNFTNEQIFNNVGFTFSTNF